MCLTLLGGGGGVSAESDNVWLLARFFFQDDPLQNIGLVLTRDAGSYVIIRSSNMIWCALLSIPILGRYPKLHQILGILVCGAGVFVKSSIMFPFIFADYKEHDYCQDGNNITNVKISSEIGNETSLLLHNSAGINDYKEGQIERLEDCLHWYIN